MYNRLLKFTMLVVCTYVHGYYYTYLCTYIRMCYYTVCTVTGSVLFVQRTTRNAMYQLFLMKCWILTRSGSVPTVSRGLHARMWSTRKKWCQSYTHLLRESGQNPLNLKRYAYIYVCILYVRMYLLYVHDMYVCILMGGHYYFKNTDYSTYGYSRYTGIYF